MPIEPVMREPDLSVIHISHADSGGGAARGAYTLHSSLKTLGVASTFVATSKQTSDPSVVGPPNAVAAYLSKANKRFEIALPRKIGDPTDLFTMNVLGSRAVSKALRLTPDVVHLHWVGFGMLRPHQIRKIKKPIVWTLRDMWPFTGGCHYDYGCGKFQSVCGSCPVLGSSKKRDLSTWGQHRKVEAFSVGNLHLVALSKWMAEQANKSKVMGGLPIRVIPPGTDLNVFQPAGQDAARSILGLPLRSKIILFPAISPEEPRKGLQVLLLALQQLATSTSLRDATLLVAGGLHKETPIESPIEVSTLGMVRDDVLMAHAYSAADITVVPSLQEAFGKVAIESLACGTPVVAFQGTGLADSIRHKATGYLAEYGSAADLAQGLQWTLNPGHRDFLLSEIERDRPRLSADREARAYLDLYREATSLIR